MLTQISEVNKYPLIKIRRGFVPVVYDTKEAIYTPGNGEDRHNIDIKIAKDKVWQPYHNYSKDGSLEELGAMYSVYQQKYLEKYPEGFHIYDDMEGAIADVKNYMNSADIEPKIAEVEFTVILAYGYRYIYVSSIEAFKGASFSVALMVRVLNVKDI